MKERPILFSAPMVRAILDGAKTQTRRVVKPQPHHGPVGEMVHLGGGAWAMDDGDLSGQWQCPYGMQGDRLWVRETFAETDFHDGTPVVTYRSDGSAIPIGRNSPDRADYLIHAFEQKPAAGELYVDKWRPSIFMPRWASRILLEITEVRVQRLQHISEPDVVSEGIQRWPLGYRVAETGAPEHASRTFDRGVDAYRWLWNSINGASAWDANPWVWALSFKRIGGDA